IQDEVQLRSRGNINWKMLTAAQVLIIGANTAILTQNGKQLRVVFDLPPGIRLKTWSADPPAAFDEANPDHRIIGFDAQLDGSRRYSLLVWVEAVGASKERAIIPIVQCPYV